MSQPERIALAFPLGMLHHELLIEGVLAYEREHERRWSFLTEPESMTLSILDPKGWQGAGIIAKLSMPAGCCSWLSNPLSCVCMTAFSFFTRHAGTSSR